MPQPQTWNISITSTGDPNPDPLSCSPGDQITWTNNYSQAITGFTLPTSVSPQQNPAPIAVGATTRAFTVNANASGTSSYGYSWPDAARGTRGGTIDVGSR